MGCPNFFNITPTQESQLSKAIKSKMDTIGHKKNTRTLKPQPQKTLNPKYPFQKNLKTRHPPYPKKTLKSYNSKKHT
jgi:hypothetical protein